MNAVPVSEQFFGFIQVPRSVVRAPVPVKAPSQRFQIRYSAGLTSCLLRIEQRFCLAGCSPLYHENGPLSRIRFELLLIQSDGMPRSVIDGASGNWYNAMERDNKEDHTTFSGT